MILSWSRRKGYFRHGGSHRGVDCNPALSLRDGYGVPRKIVKGYLQVVGGWCRYKGVHPTGVAAEFCYYSEAPAREAAVCGCQKIYVFTRAVTWCRGNV